MSALQASLLRPDHLPIILMLVVFGVLGVLWWRAVRRNDRLLVEGGETAVLEQMQGPVPGEPAAAETRSRVHAWPYLVRVELIAALVALLILTAWSILVDAPLEPLADPMRTPNPSKAPWYFLGLQEMLVYFDPWIAGVALPLLIIVGLAAIPYLDLNPRGNGYHCWRERRFAIGSFLFGFGVLWIPLIVIGVFCRGPGWSWFWPWQAWDRWSVPASPTTSWSDLLGVHSRDGALAVGALTVAVYYALGGLYWLWRRKSSPMLRSLGALRYAMVAFLLLSMLALPIKIALRWTFSVKYVLVTPWFNL